MIRFKNVDLGYDKHTLLHHINLTIKPKERIVILGASGSGKSTLLRAVAGLEAPQGGELFIDGKRASVIKDILIPPHQRHTAMIFQDLALWPHLNVADNIAFGLKMQGVSTEQQRIKVKSLLTLIGLEGYEERRIDQLSGGQRQRVALARALIVSPKILLMDEPLSNLDEALNIHLREEIVRLQEELGFTLLYVTHSKSEAQSIATRTFHIEERQLKEIDNLIN